MGNRSLALHPANEARKEDKPMSIASKPKCKNHSGGSIGAPRHYVPGPFGARPVLSRAEESRYALAYKAGDVEAGKVLALSVAPMILHICNRWQLPPGIETDDLVQDAHLGVMQALQRGTFNPRKSRLTTWVYRQVIWTCLRAVEKARRACMQNIPNPDVVTDIRHDFTEEIDRRDEQEHWLRAVFARCEELGPRPRAVLMARVRGGTLWQIAHDAEIFSCPVSRERVRQIERKAIAFVRQRLGAEENKKSSPDLE